MSNIRLFLIFFLLGFHPVAGQFVIPEDQRIEQLNLQGALPEKLLSTRSAGFYDYKLTTKELGEVQLAFQKTGIDAIIYFEIDKPFASKDVTKAFGDYLLKREIVNLIFIEKNDQGYRISITPFSAKENVIEPKQAAWSITNRLLTEALKKLYTTAANQQKKQNLLISDTPETDAKIDAILGKRNEFFATDLKVDPLAVPKTGDPAIDKELEEIFKNNYPLKFKMTEPGIPEKELRRQGQLYVLGCIYARGSVTKELLGYDNDKIRKRIALLNLPGWAAAVKKYSVQYTCFQILF